ncbi:MAG: hypothetical protein KDK39_06685 [Leptospiraceae bacterium]|nr:hypothetical protein [Leptospiraceae bacterium]
MLHDEYEDFNTEYTSRVFKARQQLVSSIESLTLLPDNSLDARSLLNKDQMQVLQSIRKKRLQPVLHRFIPD